MPIVFLHPVGLDGQCWQFLTSQRLADAIRYDCLWHGDRAQPDAPLSLSSMADDVVANTDGMLDLIGVSMGGHVAQQIALRHPDRVRSLMITSSINPPAAELLTEINPDSKQRVEMVLATGQEGLLDWAYQRWFTKTAIATPNHPGIAYVRDRLLRDTSEQFAAGWTALGLPMMSRETQKEHLVFPTTVIHSRQDNASLESKQALAELLPNGRFVVVDGPHMVQLEEPEQFEHAVLEHLDWVEGS